jgi:uncharacterized protein YcbK (DUF882 family)
MALRARTTAIWRDGGRDSSRGGPGDFGRGRRGFLRMGAALVAGLVLGDALGSSVAGASPSTRIARAALEGLRGLAPCAPRSLSFLNTHTGETLQAVYWCEGCYQPDALVAIDRVLRDHRTGDVATIDRQLLDLLHALHAGLGSDQPFHVISGYRSATTNAELRRAGRGVAARSLHMEGRAIDLRLPGTALCALRDAARAMEKGGVGFYPSPDFVHIDTGRVREW